MPKFDERFFTALRALPEVETTCGNRVYHVELVQSTGLALSKYPCLVYELESDASIPELDGPSGRREATFSVMCFSKLSADIRTLAAAIETLSQDVAQAEAMGFDWLVVRDITDSYEVPFNYDEKATKHTVLSVYILYPEDE